MSTSSSWGVPVALLARYPNAAASLVAGITSLGAPRARSRTVKQQTRVSGSVHGKLTAGLTHGWSVDGWRTRSGVVVRGHWDSWDGPATRSVRHSASSARAVRKMMSLPERSDSTGCVTRTIMRR